jgi:choline-glycine betaine transporter
VKLLVIIILTLALIVALPVSLISNGITVKEAFWYTFFATSLFSSFYLFFEGVTLVNKEQNKNKTDKVPQCNIKIFDVNNNGLLLIIFGFLIQIAIIVTFDAKRFDFSSKVNIKDNNESTGTSDKNNIMNP